MAGEGGLDLTWCFSTIDLVLNSNKWQSLHIESNFHINRFVVSANFLFSYPCECDSLPLLGGIVSIDIRSDGLHVSINFNNYATNMFIMRYIDWVPGRHFKICANWLWNFDRSHLHEYLNWIIVCFLSTLQQSKNLSCHVNTKI